MANAYKRGVRLQLTVSPQAAKAVDALLDAGLYGRSRAEVVQRLLYAQIRQVFGPPALKARK